MTRWSRLREASAHALRRVKAELSLVLQRTAAATVAWFLAGQVVDHHQPFFAPIAAVVALNASLGERGSNAVRLVLGVMLGILAGEVVLLGVGHGYGSLALASFSAMTVATLLAGPPIVVAQAATSAILTVVIGRPEEGVNRLVDALIGVGVALVFSQVLFSPEPVRLLHRAETAALEEMSASLGLAARALESGDGALIDLSISRLRELRDRLSELARMRRTSASAARHSLVWRGRRTFLVGESESAAHLDLLGGSCLMLTRIATATTPAERPLLVPILRELEDTIGDLAKAPGDRATRQRAADRVHALAQGPVTADDAPADSTSTVAGVVARMVAFDILLFAGVALRRSDEARPL